MNKKQLDYITGVWRSRAKGYVELSEVTDHKYTKGWYIGKAQTCEKLADELEEVFNNDVEE